MHNGMAALVVAGCLSFGGAAAAAPLEAYSRLPSVEKFVVAPGGGRLAFVTTAGEKRTVVVQSLDGKLQCTVTAAASKLRALEWAGNDHLLVVVSTTTTALGVRAPRAEYFIGHVLDVGACRSTVLAPKANSGMTMNTLNEMPDVRMVDGHANIFFQGVRFEGPGYGLPTLFKRDVAANSTSIVERGQLEHRGWTIDGAGQVVAANLYDERSGQWSLLAKREGRWTTVLTQDAKLDPPALKGLGRTAGTVLAQRVDGDRVVLQEISLADGRWGDVLSEQFGRLVHDPIDHRPIGGEALTTVRSYRFFDAADQARWERIARAFKGVDAALESWTADRNLVILRVTGDPYGAGYFAVDLKTSRAHPIADLYKDVGSQDIAAVQAITYKAADGRIIPAYLTLPRGRVAKGLPLVVLPHGGPGVRDEPGFDWWAQALASRGYAVLQPQFRGSSGYSLDHLAAGYGEWGRKMQTDLSDGVAHLASQGTVDPKRACVVGASYGGYAALAGATLQQDVYRCAVSVGGVSDLPSMLAFARNRLRTRDESLTIRYWLRFMGAENRRDDTLTALSPAANAAKAQAPVLLIHGRNDTVVPIDQSRQMAEALRRAGKPVKFVELKGEDHWLSLEETRVQMLAETVAFLEANNPPN